MILFLILALIGAVLVFGPRQQFDLRDVNWPEFGELPKGLDGYLAAQEAKFPDILPKQQKQILWAGKPEQKTDIAIVYLHGFSASPEEIRPVPDLIGKELNANVFFTRLAGHGRDGNAMGDVHLNQWGQDLKEAIAIGKLLGERVLVMGTSTGGTLAAAALSDADVASKIDGLIFLSPNFAVHNSSAFFANLPYFHIWGPWIAGETRSFEPSNEAHGIYWNTNYPTKSVVPMMRLIESVKGIDVSKTKIPALFYFSDGDVVVKSSVTREVAQAWGGVATIANPVLTEQDDKEEHVIAGAIQSPNQTKPATKLILEWINTL